MLADNARASQVELAERVGLSSTASLRDSVTSSTQIRFSVHTTLRDILAKRWKLSPIEEAHLRTLIEMGLVEMRDDQPALTNSRLDAIP